LENSFNFFQVAFHFPANTVPHLCPALNNLDD
jgi:hypothetical protein